MQIKNRKCDILIIAGGFQPAYIKELANAFSDIGHSVKLIGGDIHNNGNYKEITVSRVYNNQLNRSIYVVTESEHEYSSLLLGPEVTGNGSKSVYSPSKDLTLHEIVRWYETSVKKNDEGKFDPEDASYSKEYKYIIKKDF